MERKHQIVILGIYIAFLAILASANHMPVIYTYHTWTRDIYLMWVLLGISIVFLYAISIYQNRVKWLTVVAIAPLITVSTVKIGYLVWWGYYGSYLNNIGTAIIINVIAITIYAFIAISLFRMWQTFAIVFTLLTVSMIPVTYMEATAIYKNNTNKALSPDAAKSAAPAS